MDDSISIVFFPISSFSYLEIFSIALGVCVCACMVALFCALQRNSIVFRLTFGFRLICSIRQANHCSGFELFLSSRKDESGNNRLEDLFSSSSLPLLRLFFLSELHKLGFSPGFFFLIRSSFHLTCWFIALNWSLHTQTEIRFALGNTRKCLDLAIQDLFLTKSRSVSVRGRAYGHLVKGCSLNNWKLHEISFQSN